MVELRNQGTMSSLDLVWKKEQRKEGTFFGYGIVCCFKSCIELHFFIEPFHANLKEARIIPPPPPPSRILLLCPGCIILFLLSPILSSGIEHFSIQWGMVIGFVELVCIQTYAKVCQF
ncbi:hypothetical protein Ancab_026692 [Ancistrocladus abbreviatus]